MLNQPYPISERSLRGIFITSFIAGAFVALFLIIFQPFGTSEVNFPGKTLFLAGYGVIVAVGVFTISFIPVRLFTEEQWTVGKQVVFVLLNVLLTVTVSYFYLLQLGGSLSWFSFSVFLVNSMAIAVFPIMGITLADYYLKFRKYDLGARQFNSRKAKPPPASAYPTSADAAPGSPAQDASALIITDDQDRPVISLDTQRIWCLRSDRNYVDIFHLNAEEQPARTTVRNTLTSLTKNLPATFLRCHRSYVINTAGVDSITGNAQGYRLNHPAFADTPVPVSRGKSKEILGFIGE